MAKSICVAYKRLASLLASKRDQPYSTVIAWLRCHLGFSLLRSAVTCLRGGGGHVHQLIARSSAHDAIDLAVSEGRIPRGALSYSFFATLLTTNARPSVSIHLFFSRPQGLIYANWVVSGCNRQLYDIIITLTLTLTLSYP